MLVQGRCLGAIWPILGDLAMFFRCLRYNLRIVTDTAIVVTGPRIDVDLCVSTYSTLKSSSIHGAYDTFITIDH